MSIKEDRAKKRQRAYDKLENLKAERAELNDKLGMCSDEILHSESQLTLNAEPQYRVEVTGKDVPTYLPTILNDPRPRPPKSGGKRKVSTNSEMDTNRRCYPRLRTSAEGFGRFPSDRRARR